MRYDISVKIGYEYAFAASGGRHLLHLMPLHIPGRQQLVRGILDVTPKVSERNDRIDFFGNAASEVVHINDYTKLSFVMKARVECFEQSEILNISPDLDTLKREMRDFRTLDGQSPLHFLGVSEHIRLPNGIVEFAYSLYDPYLNTVALIEKIGLKVHEIMTFDPEATTVETPLEEAFEQRKGVCQDYTHIMIALLRALGIASGYVSGFIRTIPPEGEERLEGADAMHAWVRAWAGNQVGWIEYDPTNAMFVNTDHIVVAYGRDYADLAPVKGVLKSFGEQKTTQAVDVVPLDC